MYSSIEICAGAGGQALGLEEAGFFHVALVEYEQQYCNCLKSNRPEWNVICGDVHQFNGFPYAGQIDLLAGGVPCPPFSVAGKQRGADDERDLFPQMLRLVEEINPYTVMIENVRGLLDSKFDTYRNDILDKLDRLGHNHHIQLINASDYGVSQLRPRVIIIGIRKDLNDTFEFPKPNMLQALSVGEKLYDLMAENGWEGAAEWKEKTNRIAPTLVGGSKKHGGPDIVVYRDTEPDESINEETKIIDDSVCQLADIRKSYNELPILHASVSAKWTMRSDRAQNSRTEELGLIRNRKGHLPHIVVVTGEPMPSRLASLALGTGDIDCIYHFALYELVKSVQNIGGEDSMELLDILLKEKD